MRQFIRLHLMVMMLLIAPLSYAAPNLEINTPAINALKSSMQARHTKIAPHYHSGAIGLTNDGLVALRDAKAVPLKDRQGINKLISAENTDRRKLYKEIAVANGHPEWEAGIRDSFAGRWIDKAKSGWYFKKSGAWTKK